jgi:hypothetical protein
MQVLQCSSVATGKLRIFKTESRSWARRNLGSVRKEISVKC